MGLRAWLLLFSSLFLTLEISQLLPPNCLRFSSLNTSRKSVTLLHWRKPYFRKENYTFSCIIAPPQIIPKLKFRQEVWNISKIFSSSLYRRTGCLWQIACILSSFSNEEYFCCLWNSSSYWASKLITSNFKQEQGFQWWDQLKSSSVQ